MPRRALRTRDAAWAKTLAHQLAEAGVRPNTVSVAGVIFSLAGCAGFLASPDLDSGSRALALLIAAMSIQLRLLCNLLDGMIAVEEGFKTSSGHIYNDLPDRLADVLLLVGAGYALRNLPWGPPLGWLAATVALLTAYVRVLGGSIGVTQHFIGPMAKQHRMFTLTLASILAALEALAGTEPRLLAIGLLVIVSGSLVTAIRRVQRILRELEAR